MTHKTPAELAPIERIEDIPAELRELFISHVKAARHVADGDIKLLYRRIAAIRAVLADRERELRDLKGPCSNRFCALYFAHSGPCDTDTRPNSGGEQRG